MQALASPLPWLILLPLAGALAGVLSRRGQRLHTVAALGLFLTACWQWRRTGATGTEPLVPGDLAARLGIMLQADGLAANMVMMTSVVCLAAIFHARRYFRYRREQHRWFLPLMWLLWATLHHLWLASDVFTLYIGVELLGLVAVAMIAMSNEARALSAAIRYLLATLLGSLSYLLGAGLLYGSHGTLALGGLAPDVTPGGSDGVALGLMFAGLLLKAAVFPIHGWLPPAHGSATTPVSVVHSALVVKASVFVMLRLWQSLDAALAETPVSLLLGLLGLASMLWGSLMALRQERLKMVVAYSTVAQTGYLLLFFPLVDVALDQARALALEGTLYQMLAHGLAKASLFMAAGNLILATGRDHIASLAGTGRYLPMTLVTIGMAATSLMGLPPAAGFVAKWQLAHSALLSGQWWWMIALLAGGLLTATYLFRVMRQSFLEGPEEDIFRHPPRTLEIAAFVLALISLLLGLGAMAPLSLLQIAGGAP